MKDKLIKMLEKAITMNSLLCNDMYCVDTIPCDECPFNTIDSMKQLIYELKNED